MYTNKQDDFTGSDLCQLRAHKFMNNKSTLLKLLPPTEDAFQQHLKRAALATLIDKNAHKPVCKHLDITKYGWKYESSVPVPVPSLHPAWPSRINDTHPILSLLQRMPSQLLLC